MTKGLRSKGTEGVESRNNCSNACPRLKSATYKIEHHISEELTWSNGEVLKNEWRELRICVWRSANSWGVVCSVEPGSIVVLLYLVKKTGNMCLSGGPVRILFGTWVHEKVRSDSVVTWAFQRERNGKQIWRWRRHQVWRVRRLWWHQ